MIENATEKRDLLIIGNGFDLKCGLKTSFSDYLNSFCNEDHSGIDVKQTIDKLSSINESNIDYTYNTDPFILKTENEIYEQLYNRLINIDSSSLSSELIKDLKSIDKSFFDFYFNLIKSNDKNWSDVESKLSCLISTGFINDVFEGISMFISLVRRAQKIDRDYFLQNRDSLLKDFKYDSEKFYKKYKSELSFIFLMVNVFDYQVVNHSYNYFVNFFFKQLNDFEKNVGNYIENQTLKKHYLSNSKQLVEKFSISNDYNVLNFNYTNPFEKLIRYFPIFEISNIHGTTVNPIIGVDSSVVDDNNEIKFNKFTKTYRIMSNTEEHQDILPKNISTIYFYGHSLAPADYSYFQSIFDYYDLYGSDLELVFYYTVYDEDKENNIVSEQIDHIWNLINKYGKSMGNKKGENLLHKLNLENRIKIEKI